MSKIRKQLTIKDSSAKDLEAALQNLLANYHMSYLNTHGFHWNVKGEIFFNLHQVLNDLYDELLVKVDEVAERLLSLGFTPIHTAVDFQEYSSIKPQQNLSDPQKIATAVLQDLEVILGSQRKVREIADEAGDYGTVNQMEDYIQQTEKHIWMWSAFLGN
jgi:starvation-inducible DNA-binding protein